MINFDLYIYEITRKFNAHDYGIYSTDLIQNSRIPEVFKSSRKIRNIFTVHAFLSKSAGSYMYVY